MKLPYSKQPLWRPLTWPTPRSGSLPSVCLASLRSSLASWMRCTCTHFVSTCTSWPQHLLSSTTPATVWKKTERPVGEIRFIFWQQKSRNKWSFKCYSWLEIVTLKFGLSLWLPTLWHLCYIQYINTCLNKNKNTFFFIYFFLIKKVYFKENVIKK